MQQCPICRLEFRHNGCNHTLLEASAHVERLKEFEHLKELLEPWIRKIVRQELDKQ